MRISPLCSGTRMRWASRGYLGGDLPLRLQIQIAFLRRSNRLLLQDEAFTFIVCLDELHLYQHCPRKEDADPYPDVHRLALPVHEHFLGATDLLAHGIVDRITGAPLGFLLPCAARTRSPVHCCLGHFLPLSRWLGGGMSGRAEAGGKSRPLRSLPTVPHPGSCSVANAPDWVTRSRRSRSAWQAHR